MDENRESWPAAVEYNDIDLLPKDVLTSDTSRAIAGFRSAPLNLSILDAAGDAAAPRWTEGERLHNLIEHCCAVHSDRIAVETETETLTYAELNAKANQLARYLVANGVKPGDRVGLLFAKTSDTYVALLAVLKANAAYVPLDQAFPAGRLKYIAADAQLTAIVSLSSLMPKLDGMPVRQIYLDLCAADIAGQPAGHINPLEVSSAQDDTCYIIYTSGTTGNPKGVVIEHASICNFVRVAAGAYGFKAGDRVYQGMTIAFDFSIEEIWVPLMAGATLVPGIQGRNLIGEELGEFLHHRRITCLCCCPTLLSTIDRDLPELRVMLLGGEACPQNLVERWHRAGRTILNSYGPTETTVTAMLTELHPDIPVTIGTPLPTYSIVVLDPELDCVLPAGDLGEIGIAGIGVARGYLNNDDLTRRKFIPDFIGLANNTSKRIYRTGDLGRLNAEGEIEYHGRIDTQVKINGYRIELSEIEAVLLEFPEIAQAAVSTHEPEPGMVELVAYYAVKSDANGPKRESLARELRTRLPGYMVPSYIEELEVLPMSVSNKTDYKKLPPPSGPRLYASSNYSAPEDDSQQALCAALSKTLKIERVSIDDDFFQDMGANSLSMARFCSALRDIPDLAHVSMKDIYLCPTVRQLSSHLQQSKEEGFAPLAVEPDPLRIPSNFAYWGCGVLQLAAGSAYGLLMMWLMVLAGAWVTAAEFGSGNFLLRSAIFAAAVLIVPVIIPVAAKWALIGRWQAGQLPIWSLRYFRFWLVSTLVRSSPAAMFAGTPIFNVYLRLLGAKIGRNAVILSRSVPVCTDLFSVGDNTILRKDSILPGYRAQSNVIHMGRIDIGSRSFVGEAAVLDIDTAIGDDAQLGHVSSLQSGQRIPDGKRYHGSPAIETTADYRVIGQSAVSSLRRGIYSTIALVGLFLSTWLVLASGIYFLGHSAVPGRLGVFDTHVVLTLIGLSLSLFAGGLVLGLAWVIALPRLCQMLLTPGKVYPMFGLHYWLQSIVSRTSNSQFFNLVFGDSSFIIHYLRWIGWDLGKVYQTGSNFGTNQRHDNPFLCRIGDGTMASDGLSMINLHMSSAFFSLQHAAIGPNCYLGNDIHFPPDARTGANCLLATKVLVPVDGPVRQNVGLLGSPSFEIPRMVERDRSMIGTLDEAARQQKIREKNRHNITTIALFLASRWLFGCVMLFAAAIAVAGYAALGIFAPFLAAMVMMVLSICYFALIERATLGFGKLEPGMFTIYDQHFWHHERHWKLSDSPIVSLFAGTPFRNIVSRMLGVKVGSKVYDGGAVVTERTLTEIGDNANLNEGCVLQAHSLEEGVFKSDHVRVGPGCTVGPAAFVHYGATLGERSVLDADSFLMKGERVSPGSGWRGNPARLHRAPNG
ncbi:MAG: amino acid adenylation domain-containing protein [Hyphomicrobiales bacterium]|nr:amino acid adenylation domain-containing protein [Hyphomicrobiales bacterium]